MDHERPLVIGGKSVGGRIASLLLNELHANSVVAAGVCLGYPFHPLGKPEVLRTQHLRDMTAPCLIVQGERDAMGQMNDVAGYDLSQPSGCTGSRMEITVSALESARAEPKRKKSIWRVKMLSNSLILSVAEAVKRA